jgi:hypothetical protein
MQTRHSRKFTVVSLNTITERVCLGNMILTKYYFFEALHAKGKNILFLKKYKQYYSVNLYYCCANFKKNPKKIVQ